MATAEERFWSKVEFTESCWLWLASRNRSGYGQFNASGRSVLAHRWAYEQLVGPIPRGLSVDHLCRTPACVRPEHLEPVSLAENSRRQPYGAVQWQQAKTHCPRGHELTLENTMRYGQRSRQGQVYAPRKCKTCHYQVANAWKRRTRAAAKEAVA